MTAAIGPFSPVRLTQAALLSLALLVAACATRPPVSQGPVAYPPAAELPGLPSTPSPYLPPPPGAVSLSYLPGWADEDYSSAFSAYVDTCARHKDPQSVVICGRAQALSNSRTISAGEARDFFEASFVAVEARTTDGIPGLLTAYFAPIYPARWYPDSEYDAPVLSRPANLTNVGDRSAIDAGSAQSQVLAWMKAEDLFFLQIQGSGTLTFPDGTRLRAAYAADNGKRFLGIARPMAERGLLPPHGTSGDAIRRWLSDHRGAEAKAIMALNPRYIFFTTSPDDGREAVGAANIPLPARRSIAVDPGHWSYGQPVWIEADGGNLMGARGSYRGLVIALDTGSAIRGPVRADLYMGRGDEAGAEAGTVRHPLRMWRLIPRG